jgi:hypothetical protein
MMLPLTPARKSSAPLGPTNFQVESTLPWAGVIPDN